MSNQQHEGNGIVSRRSIGICLLGLLLVCYVDLLRLEPAIMLKQLITHFRLRPFDLGKLASSYYMLYTYTLIIVGILLDIISPAIIVFVSVLVATMANFYFTYGVSITNLAKARGLLGIASAFVTIGVLKLATLWIPKKHFVFFVGLIFACAILLSSFGGIFLGPLLRASHWQTVSNFLSIIGVVLCIAILFTFRRRDSKGQKYKIISMGEIISVLANYKIWIAGFVALFGWIFFSVFIELWGVPFFRNVHNLTLGQAAFVIAWAFVGFAVGCLVNGFVADFSNKRRLLLFLSYLFSSILIILIFFIGYLTFPLVAALLFIIGYLLGSQIICYGIAYDYTTTSNVGLALTIVTLIVVYGNLILQPIIGTIIGVSHVALLLLPFFLVVGALLSLILSKPKLIFSEPDKNIAHELVQYWKGHGSLGRSFWLVYIFGSTIFGIIGIVVTELIIPGSFALLFPGGPLQLMQIPTLFYLVILPYYVFSAVCVWRCAMNTSWKGWGYIARVIVILELLNLIAIIVLRVIF